MFCQPIVNCMIFFSMKQIFGLIGTEWEDNPNIGKSPSIRGICLNIYVKNTLHNELMFIILVSLNEHKFM